MSKNRKEYLKDYIDVRKRINISVSGEEYKLIEYLAEQEGLKPTSFVYELVKSKLKDNPFVANEIALELKDLKFLLKNVANNINQIAYHSNRFKKLLDENKVLESLQELEKIIVDYTSSKIEER